VSFAITASLDSCSRPRIGLCRITGFVATLICIATFGCKNSHRSNYFSGVIVIESGRPHLDADRVAAINLDGHPDISAPT
jgi:hypothetical protein